MTLIGIAMLGALAVACLPRTAVAVSEVVTPAKPVGAD
jgi:hypothetical protein